jgi:glutamine amidotransferase
MSKTTLIDYGAGNVKSVSFALERLGITPVLSNDPDEIKSSDYVIFPGVGHAKTAMEALRKNNLVDLIPALKQPVLGVCLGMQLMCRFSEEGNTPGLGIFDVDVIRFNENLKVPHMGWNVVSTSRENPLLPDSNEEQRFYFVHSYKVVPDDPAITIGTANHGGEFCAAFQQGNVFGVQFHPEKSHRFGMELMRRFVEL